MPGPVFLLSDFGLQDPYVGLMKGRIINREPAPRVVDLTHQVEHGNELAAAFLLEYSCPHLPEEAVVLAVVDPEVGSDRKIIAVKTVSGRYVVAPDTGLADGLDWEKAVYVENKKVFRNSDCDTFHGRDRFAPVARFLSQGGELGFLGSSVKNTERRSIVPEPVWNEGKTRGEIIYCDHFGNCITNFKRDDVPEDPLFVVQGKKLTQMAGTYEKLAGPGIVFGSFNRAEIAVSRGSAAEELKLKPGMKVEIKSAESN
ncbi:MAG: SAM hydrolase/SAM-dependent halogenase family protein [bacterium]